MNSFIDFYNNNSIIPVRQGINDWNIFSAKRRYLLNSLGIPCSLLPNVSVCEFGPGTGQNTRALIADGVANLTLVEGSLPAIKFLEDLRSDVLSKMNKFDLVHANFLDYQPNKTFDLVLAEGCIPHQSSPHIIAEKISSHVSPSGVFVMSTISGLSHLSETLRRVLSSLLLGKQHPEITDLPILTKFFEPDLNSLKSRSRFSEDWCLDVIVQPLHHSKLFSIPDSVSLLCNDFEVYHSLPGLLSPFYWYKSYDQSKLVEESLSSYHSSNMCFISKDLPPLVHSAADGKNAEILGDLIWHAAAQFQYGKGSIDDIILLLKDLEKVYMLVYPAFSEMLSEVIKFIACFDRRIDNKKHAIMQGFWGRGQQYISFIRK